MDIDLERARRALTQLGEALDEVRGVIRFGPEGTVRIKTDDKVINLPISWAVAAAVAFVVAAVLSNVPTPTGRRRRYRDEEPLGIG